MMGSGKTTIGRLLADRLGFAYRDSDEEIERKTGRTVREIFETHGEAAFREEETAALRVAIEGDADAVIGVAGGAVLHPANRDCIARAGTVVWLRGPMELLAERASRGEHRPLLDGDAEGALRRLYRQREPIYAELADLVVDIDGRTPAQIVDLIVEARR